MICPLLFISGLLIIQFCQSDQGYYSDTGAIGLNQDFLISAFPIVSLTVRTSNAYLAGTVNSIYATFVGEFSSSGTHNLGSFAVGTTVQVNVTLSRNIGRIQSLILANNQSDGWLPLYIQCIHDDEWYEFGVQSQWISTQNTEQLVEPNTQLINDILIFPIMQLNVSAIAPIYLSNP